MTPLRRALLWSGVSAVVLVPMSLHIAQKRLDEARYEGNVALLISEQHNATGKWLSSADEVEKELRKRTRANLGYAALVRTHERGHPTFEVVHQDPESLTLRIRFQWLLGGTYEVSLTAQE